MKLKFNLKANLYCIQSKIFCVINEIISDDILIENQIVYLGSNTDKIEFTFD